MDWNRIRSRFLSSIYYIRYEWKLYEIVEHFNTENTLEK